MGIPLRILIIEDSEDDALLVARVFKKSGYNPIYERVETADAMLDAIEGQTWDIIISDHKMPRFSGLEALKLYQAKGLDIPFIIVSGTIGEDVAAEAMTSGAHDYVMKNNLSRLVPAIQRELREAEIRRNKRETDEMLRENECELRLLFQRMINAFVLFESVFDEDGSFISYRFVYINDSYERITGVKQEEVKGKTVHEVWPGTEESWIKAYGEVAVTGVPSNFEMYHEPTGKLYYCTVYRPGENSARFCVIFEDITERKRADDALRESENKYKILFDSAGDAIFVHDAVEARMLAVNQTACERLGYAHAELMSMTIDQLDSLTEASYVPDRMVRLMELGHLSFETVHHRKDGLFIPMEVNARRIAWNGQPAIMSICRDITPRKQAEEELKQTLEKLRKSLIGTIQALSATVETRDPYTAGHQRRVSSLARTIAQEMRLPKDMIDNIRIASAIHDIGKISVPAEILIKPGRITDIEMSLIKVQSQSGYDILKDVDLPYPIAETILQHHERLNGSGYPQGLNGDQILLEARIISVADVVEATASHRPYRPARGIDAALEEIEKNKGILYDEKAVEACIKLFQEKNFKFE